MAKITIYGKGLKGVEIKAVKDLVGSAGGGQGEVKAVETVGAADADYDDEVLIVLGTPAVCADGKLEANLVKAHGNGQRVIWVWPDGAEDAAPPPAVKHYCYSRIPWDPTKLRTVIQGDDVILFETPSGKPDPNPETDRLCVEEKSTTK
jgi:hypothetical protein